MRRRADRARPHVGRTAASTVGGVDQATGHSFTHAPTDSVMLTVQKSPFGAPPTEAYTSEQNGLLAGRAYSGPDAALVTTPPGDGNQICVRGQSDADPHVFAANFGPGIELLDSCGNGR